MSAAALAAVAPGRAWTLAHARSRLALCVVLFILGLGVLALRLADLAILDRAAVNAVGARAAPRGELTDRRGVVLAQSYEAYALVVRPHQLVGAPADLAPRIAALTGDDPARVRAALTYRGKFRYVARRVRPEVAQSVRDLGDPGLELQREPDRLYPNMGLASHVLGFTGVDGSANAGMELALDDRLGRGPVALSIDARAQQALESELAFGMAKHSAIGAAGVILDVHTGEVLALASLPRFNPNAAGRDPGDARFNRATLGVFELGSTFKPFTVAMALDAGVTKITDIYDASHPLRVARYTIRDFRGKHRPLSVPEVLVHSSNIGTARIAERVGPARQRAVLDQLGFLDAPAVELPERGRPLYPANWSRLSTMTVGYGHGIAVTPLHLASAYAALANGGTWRPATLLKATGPPPKGRRVFTEETSATMRRLLRLVVLKGSGKKADAPGYRLGGKTGTADKAQQGGYNRRERVATFAGVFPIEAPRYVIVAMLDGPQATKDTYGFATAGWVSAPIVKRVVERTGPMLGIAPDLTRDLAVDGLLPGDEKVEE